MKTLTSIITGLMLAAVTLTCHTAFAVTTGELLQQGLYAEEVEGNIDSAIKTYDKVIKNSSAPANHVAQALYRQGMCYIKIKDEPAAKAVLEKLVTGYPDQTDLVEKARPVLEDMTDFDPATLMPPGTLAYIELGSPGKQIETILGMLKGTPYENPLAAVGGQSGGNSGQKSPGDIAAALLNPAMTAEFKKIRSTAMGITGLEQNHPQMISVLYPGKSDALRGLILAGLGMAGSPGEAIEGMQRVNLPEDMAVAYDDRVVIMARPASQLTWSVRQYKGVTSEPTLASNNKSFARLGKATRQNNVMTLWAKVDEVYARVLKTFPAGQIPAGVLSANAIVDFANIDEFTFTESINPTGLGSQVALQFKDGHHCLAYDLIRTPNITRAALELVPSEAIALASFSLSQADAVQSEKVRAKVQNVTGLDLGRELFSNLGQVTLFAMPADGKSAGETTNPFLPGRLGLALTSGDPNQTRQILTTLLGTMNGGQPNPNPGQFKISKNGQPDLFCYLEQVNGSTLLSLNRAIVDAGVAAMKSRKSVTTSGPLNNAVSRLNRDAGKLILVNAGAAIRLLGPLMTPANLNEEQTRQLNASLDELAKVADATTVELRTDEQINRFSLNSGVTGIPPLNQIFGPLMQIARITKEANAETAARNLQRGKPATVMPATKAPVIDGQEDEAWAGGPRNKLENVIPSFGSGEKASPPSSPDDLSANFRALWDEQDLYLFVDVTDDKLVNDTDPDHAITVPTGSTVIPWWYDDSVEVYIDGDNAKSTEYGPNDFHFRFNWGEKPSMRVYNRNQEVQLDGIEFAMVRTDKGYSTEAKFPWKTLHVKPVAGASIGLDVHVNDDDNGGERDTKITWRDPVDSAWQNPQSFGNAELAGLVGWWKFDETQGNTAQDSSGGNHNGTLVGNARFGKGKVGGAIDLDGAGSFVRITDKSAFDIGGEITIAAWVNFRSSPTEWAAIVAKGDSAWRLSTAWAERKFHTSIGQGDSESVDGTTPVNAGEWHHVTAVFGSGFLRLYVDGRLEDNQTRTEAMKRNDFEVLIGENAERQGRCFNGLLDDVRIYNYALSTDQIMALAAGQ